MYLLLNPRLFNYTILALFALAAVRWTIAGNWPQALYHLGAVILNVAVTFGMDK
jgi:hypothetical protein